MGPKKKEKKGKKDEAPVEESGRDHDHGYYVSALLLPYSSLSFFLLIRVRHHGLGDAS